MPQGPGTYGRKVGRPKKLKKEDVYLRMGKLLNEDWKQKVASHVYRHKGKYGLALKAADTLGTVGAAVGGFAAGGPAGSAAAVAGKQGVKAGIKRIATNLASRAGSAGRRVASYKAKKELADQTVGKLARRELRKVLSGMFKGKGRPLRISRSQAPGGRGLRAADPTGVQSSGDEEPTTMGSGARGQRLAASRVYDKIGSLL